MNTTIEPRRRTACGDDLPGQPVPPDRSGIDQRIVEACDALAGTIASCDV
jgi:hypothetical protein